MGLSLRPVFNKVGLTPMMKMGNLRLHAFSETKNPLLIQLNRNSITHMDISFLN